MRAAEIALDLLNYYNRTRGVGHTKAMLDGARNSKAIILVSHIGEAREFEGGVRKRCLAIEDPSFSEKLRGLRSPLAVDNYTIVRLLLDISMENDRLRSENARLLNQLEEKK